MNYQYAAPARCSHCGQMVPVIDLSRGEYSFDPREPDTRSPNEDAYNLPAAVQHCRGCGRCSSDVTKSLSTAAANTLTSSAYRELLNEPRLPELARHFNAQAELAAADGLVEAAAMALLRATWACDDAGLWILHEPDYPTVWHLRPEVVREGQVKILDPNEPALSPVQREHVQRFVASCRTAASHRLVVADRWADALACGRPPTNEMGSSMLVLADLLRRAGAFDRATAVAQEALRLPSDCDWDDETGDALHYQLKLSYGRNVDAFTFHAAARARPDHDARQVRRRERERERAAEQARAAAEQARATAIRVAWAVPRELTLPLREALASAGKSPPDAALLQRLPLPDGVAADLVRIAERGGWPATATLGALGVAVRRVLRAQGENETPTAWTAADDRRCVEACSAYPGIDDYLAHVLSRCTSAQWHWWVPQGNDGGPLAPDYRGGPD